MPRISPFLWFDHQAEEAAQLYCSIFPNSKIVHVTRYGDAGPGPKGSVMVVAFELDGQQVLALNGGPRFELTEAFSLAIECKTQEEIDRYWSALTAGGGQPGQCGWLKDKFGLSWQVVPDSIGRLMTDPDPAKSKRVMAAIMSMTKIDLAKLDRAVRGD